MNKQKNLSIYLDIIAAFLLDLILNVQIYIYAQIFLDMPTETKKGEYLKIFFINIKSFIWRILSSRLSLPSCVVL